MLLMNFKRFMPLLSLIYRSRKRPYIAQISLITGHYRSGTKNPENPKDTCRVRLYDGSRGAACYLVSVLNAAEYRGWSEGHVRVSHAAMWLATHGMSNTAAGIGA